jgi:hypothetical protein
LEGYSLHPGIFLQEGVEISFDERRRVEWSFSVIGGKGVGGEENGDDGGDDGV